MKYFTKNHAFIRFAMIMAVLVTGLLSIIASGGPKYAWRSDPFDKIVTNEFFEAKIRPECGYDYNIEASSCKGFLLTIENKTDKDLELIWDKTLYIDNGQTSGGFMYEGIIYKDRNNPKPPDIIFAKNTFTRSIYPNNLIRFQSGRFAKWLHDSMSSGAQGVYLTVKLGNNEIREKLILNLYKEALK